MLLKEVTPPGPLCLWEANMGKKVEKRFCIRKQFYQEILCIQITEFWQSALRLFFAMKE